MGSFGGQFVGFHLLVQSARQREVPFRGGWSPALPGLADARRPDSRVWRPAPAAWGARNSACDPGASSPAGAERTCLRGRK